LAGKEESNILSMGATLPPCKTYSWSGNPIQHAVHDLLEAVAGGNCREFGTPSFMKRWRWLSMVAPSLVDARIMRHVRKTRHRSLPDTPVEGGENLRRIGSMRIARTPISNRNGRKKGKVDSGSSRSVCNKTWA
jgi:hypothetical protein